MEEDYEWVTANLVNIANSVCNGRIVSALEGGYQIKGEHCSAFARSVKQHVTALIRGTTSRAVYDAASMDREKEVERGVSKNV